MSPFPPPGDRDEGPSEADIARAEAVASERQPSGRTWLSRMWKPLAVLGGTLLAASLLVELLVFLPRRDNGPSAPKLVPATVTRVIDGRTLEVEVRGGAAVVRYIGVGAPELGAEYSGLVLDLNRQWVGGRDVMLEQDTVDRDSGGRLLRYVYVDGSMVNAALIAAGFAWVEDPGPNSRYRDGFAQLEVAARAEGRGLWAHGAKFRSTGAPGTRSPGDPQAWRRPEGLASPATRPRR